MKNVVPIIVVLFVLVAAWIGVQNLPTSAAIVSSLADKANGGGQVLYTPSAAQRKFDVRGAPTISSQFINQVLAKAHSPAAGLGQDLYMLGVKYGIDPVYALSFFKHESSYGTTGVARVTLSLGNMRCVPEYACLNENGGYAQFDTWHKGFVAWFKLIRHLYIEQWNLTTVPKIIPVYAPSSDHNNVAGYIAAVEWDVSTWRSQQ